MNTQTTRPAALRCLSIVLFSLLLTAASAAQPTLNIPIPEVGDRFVYVDDAGRPSGLLYRFSAGYLGCAMFFYSWHPSNRYFRIYGGLEIDSSGVLAIVGQRDMRYDLYHVAVPASETVLFNGLEWSWELLDTTVLGREVRAIRYRNGFGKAQRVRIVAEHFGLVLDTDPIRVMRLGNAIMGGVVYNPDTVFRSWVSDCEDRRMQYRCSTPGGRDFYVWYTASQDTMLDDRRYAYHPIDGTPVSPHGGSGGRHVANTGQGLVLVSGHVVLKANAGPGDVVSATKLLTDTTSVPFANRLRRAMHLTAVSPGETYEYSTIVEGIGLTKLDGWGWAVGDWRMDLIYYEGCGESWGTPVSVDEAAGPPQALSLTVAPSLLHGAGASAKLMIWSPSAASARLYVTDILGRTVRDRELWLDAGMTWQSLELHGLASGMYLVCVQSSRQRAVAKLVIR